MYFSNLWNFTKQSFVEYVCFMVLDLWAKSALKRTSCDNEKRHIWASEAQILFVGCLITFFWYKVCPVVLTLLGVFCYRSSRPPRKRDLVSRIDSEGVHSIASKVYHIWFSFFVMIGNAVSVIFNQLKWNGNREYVAESLLWCAGFYTSRGLNFFFSVVEKIFLCVYRNCRDWQDMLRSNQWDTYQCVSQEQIQGSPTDVSSDKLLCHPECELSQRNPCRISASVSGNHFSPNENYQRQVTGCYPMQTPSMLTSAIKTQVDKLFGLVRRILGRVYYHLSQCGKIKLMPHSYETSGENLCFVNTVLHCFTKEPSLRKFMLEIVNEQSFFRANISADEAQFLESLHVLLTQNEANDAHLKQFVAACSKLVPTLISTPGSEQLQQDVVEFTQWMLNKLHCCFKIKKDANVALFQRSSVRKCSSAYDQHQSTTVLWKPSWLDKVKCSIIQPSETLLKTMQQYACSEWISYKKDNASLISNNFTGQMLDCYQCIMCNQISAQSQTFTILPLALTTASTELTLQQAIRHFLRVEDMEVSEGCACAYSKLNSPVHKLDSFEHNILGTPAFSFKSESSAKTSTPVSTDDPHTYDCDAQILSPIGLDIIASKNQSKCQLYSSGMNKLLKKTWFKRTFISRAPKYLIFQLLRFQFDNKSLTKSHQPVRIPLYKLCVPVVDSGTSWGEQKSATVQKEYELCAFIVHLGAKSLSYGHYVAYIRSLDHPTIWTKYDDNVMCKVSDIHSEIDSAIVKENVYLLFYRQTSMGG